MPGTMYSAKKLQKIQTATWVMFCLFGISGMASAQAIPDHEPAPRKRLDLPRPQPLVREADLDSGANLTLEVNVGDVHIVPAERGGGKLRLVLAVKHFDDASRAASWVREFSVSGT